MTLSPEALPHYTTARTTGGAWRVQGRCLLRFFGPDRVRYLNGQTTHDIRKLAPRNSLRAAVCSGKGRLMADVWVSDLALPDTLLVDGPAALGDAFAERMEKYLIADDVFMEPMPPAEGLLWHLWGSAAATAKTALPQAPWCASARLGFADGIDFLLTETAFLALGLPLCPDEVAEVLRIENGVPIWGKELDENTLPPEAGEENWIRYDKGCYVGQETIARIKSIGHVNRLLQGLVCEGDTPAPGAVVRLGPEADAPKIGILTSTAFSPTLQKGIALAYIQRQYLQQTTAYIESHVAHLTPLPFALRSQE